MAKGKEGVLDGNGSDENDRHKSHKRRKDRSTDDEDDDGPISESSDGSRDRHRSRRAGKEKKSRRKARKRGSRRRSSSEIDDDEDYSSSSSSSSYSESEGDSETEESEEEARRRRRRKRKERRRREREEEERRRRRRKREKKRRKEEEEEKRRRKKKKKERALGKTGAVTNSWGKYGIIRETDMWNKRPEFTAWLAEIKQVNLESLSNWEEKQMFKEFMEDHNTATFPSKKYYDLEAYHHRQMQKEWKKGAKKNQEIERTVFNDEEQRRQELLKEREKMKEQQVEVLKRSMQSGMAQAMKEQQLLKEEMAYQYKLGNFEAAAAIQRRLDPDAAM